MDAPKKAKPGRPSKREGLDLDRVKALAAAGLTMEQLAVVLEVNVDSLYQWLKDSPEFSEAIKASKAIADDRVERALFERAIGYSHPEEKIFCSEGIIVRAQTTKHYPPDTAAAFIWLKNRRGDVWRDKIEQEHRFPEALVLKSADGKVLTVLGSA